MVAVKFLRPELQVDADCVLHNVTIEAEAYGADGIDTPMQRSFRSRTAANRCG